MKLSDIGWRTKLLTLFSIVLVATLLVQVFYIIPNLQEREMSTAVTQNEETSRIVASETNIKLEGLVNTLRFIANDSVFREMILENQTETLLQYAELLLSVETLAVLNSTGWFVSGTMTNFEMFTTRSFAESSFFYVPYEQGVVNYGTPFSHEEDVIGMSVSVPIYSYIGEIVGVLMGTLNLNNLVSALRSHHFSNGTTAYIVTSDGMVIAHSKIDLFSLEGGPLSLNYSSEYLVQVAQVDDSESTSIFYHNESMCFGVIIKLEPVGWWMITETPLDVMMAESNAMATNLLIVNILIFGFGLGFALIFAQQIVKQEDEKNKELRFTQDRLLQQERMAGLGKISGGIGHELRNPLSAIKASAYFLKTTLVTSPSEVIEAIDIIENEVNNCDRIITSLLDFARPRPLAKEKVQVNEILKTALSQVTTPDDVDVITFFDDSIPIVLADSTQLAQAFQNLIINGIQAMTRGGVLKIVTEFLNKEEIVIAFSDTGEGISEENLDRIFEPLFTTKVKGIGLGLVITESFVKRQGGRIDVHSVEGEGTTFRIILPATKGRL